MDDFSRLEWATSSKVGQATSYLWVYAQEGIKVSDKHDKYSDFSAETDPKYYKGVIVLFSKSKKGYVFSYREGIWGRPIPNVIWRSIEYQFPAYDLHEGTGMLSKSSSAKQSSIAPMARILKKRSWVWESTTQTETIYTKRKWDVTGKNWLKYNIILTANGWSYYSQGQDGEEHGTTPQELEEFLDGKEGVPFYRPKKFQKKRELQVGDRVRVGEEEGEIETVYNAAMKENEEDRMRYAVRFDGGEKILGYYAEELQYLGPGKKSKYPKNFSPNEVPEFSEEDKRFLKDFRIQGSLRKKVKSVYMNGYAQHACDYIKKHGKDLEHAEKWAKKNGLRPEYFKEAIGTMSHYASLKSKQYSPCAKCNQLIEPDDREDLSTHSHVICPEVTKIPKLSSPRYEFPDEEWRQILRENKFEPHVSFTSNGEIEYWTSPKYDAFVRFKYGEDGYPYFEVFWDEVTVLTSDNSSDLRLFLGGGKEVSHELTDKDKAELKEMGIIARLEKEN